MTEDRLRKIAMDMEGPLIQLQEIRVLVDRLLEGCSDMNQDQAAIYALIARNLDQEHDAIKELWRELFDLTVKSDDRPPLKVV